VPPRSPFALLRGLVIALLATAPFAWAGADRPSARLSFAKKSGAAVCPEESGFRALVAARLGYDPFREDAGRTVSVTFLREGGTLRARLEMKDGAGKVVGTRVLAGAECGELANSTALAVAIAIDPLGGSGAPSASVSPSVSTPASVSASAPVASAVPSAAPVPSSTATAPLPETFPTVSLGGFGAFGAGPQLNGGLTASAGVRTPSFSLAVEGRVDAETGKPGPDGGRVSSSILAGALVPCLHHELLMGCALVAYGSLRGSGAGVTEARSDQSPWAALGVRLGMEALFLGPFALRAHVDWLAPLTRTTLRVQGTDAWTTPAFQFLAGLAVVGHFR